VDFGPQVAGRELQDAGRELQDAGRESGTRDASRELQDAGRESGTRVASCGTRVAGRGPRVTRRRSPVTTRGASHCDGNTHGRRALDTLNSSNVLRGRCKSEPVVIVHELWKGAIPEAVDSVKFRDRRLKSGWEEARIARS
jgi:hypothetical protein